MNKVWRIIDLINWSESYFKEKLFQNPRSEIEWLLCSLFQCSRLDLYMRFEEPLQKSQLLTLRSWVKRRLKNEPLQYITGSCDFYGRNFLVNANVLIPRPETERLIDESIKCIEHINCPKILDIGSGSGCISITMAKEREDSVVLGLDFFEESIKISKKNADNLKANNVSFIKMDILNNFPKQSFDLVISNPPYIAMEEISTLMKDVKDYEPEVALTDFNDGLTFYRRYSSLLPYLLNESSSLVLEVGLGNHPQEVISIFKESGFSDIHILKDYNGDDRVIIVKN